MLWYNLYQWTRNYFYRTRKLTIARRFLIMQKFIPLKICFSDCLIEWADLKILFLTKPIYLYFTIQIKWLETVNKFLRMWSYSFLKTSFLKLYSSAFYYYISDICYRPQRSCGQGNIFTPVCHSVHGGVCPSACWDTTPPGADTPPDQTPPR